MHYIALTAKEFWGKNNFVLLGGTFNPMKTKKLQAFKTRFHQFCKHKNNIRGFVNCNITYFCT